MSTEKGWKLRQHKIFNFPDRYLKNYQKNFRNCFGTLWQTVNKHKHPLIPIHQTVKKKSYFCNSGTYLWWKYNPAMINASKETANAPMQVQKRMRNSSGRRIDLKLNLRPLTVFLMDCW